MTLNSYPPRGQRTIAKMLREKKIDKQGQTRHRSKVIDKGGEQTDRERQYTREREDKKYGIQLSL